MDTMWKLGWATTNKNIDLPNSKTLWKIEGNKKLTPNSSIKLSWKNNQNIKFTKKLVLIINIFLTLSKL